MSAGLVRAPHAGSGSLLLRRTSAVLLAIVVGAGCAAREADPLQLPTVINAGDRRVRSLQADLAAILAAPELQRSLVVAAVQSLDRGDVLFGHNADRLVVPASNQKLLTVAAAAERLGWDYRFVTTVHATGPIEAGVLHGDLLVIGSGDPTISHRYGEASGTVLARWASHLKAAGITRIDGRIVGDDRTFADEPWGMGWAWDDIVHAYSSPVGALQLEDNAVALHIAAGAEAGAPAVVTLEAASGLWLEAQVVTTEPETPPVFRFDRVPGQRTLRVTGSVPAGAPPLVRYVSVVSATEQFVDRLRVALEAHGIDVARGAADVRHLSDPPAPPGPPLIEHRSPPLSDVAAVTLKMTHNLHAESLLRALALTEAPVASVESGGKAVVRVLEAWGVPAESVVVADGSGLSRYNHLTATALLTVLVRMASDERHRDAWFAALPTAGIDGTLATRFVDSVARGRVRAKTGTMSYVRALSGYARTLDGEMLVFAFIVNQAAGRRGPVDAVIDRAVERLVTFRR